LGYSAAFGDDVRRPTTSFANVQAIENKWKEVTIKTVRKSIAQWKTDWMRLKQNGGVIRHIFL